MLDLMASCDQSFRDGLRVSGRCALSPSCLELLRQHVYYDPTSESGLRWTTALYSRNNRGHESNQQVARNFFIGKTAYQSSSVVLILHGIWPKPGIDTTTRKDAAGPWGDVSNLEWATRSDALKRTRKTSRSELVRSLLGNNVPNLDESQRLGPPCKKGHKWNGFQLCLYVKHGNGWRCKQCHAERCKDPASKAKKKRQREDWYARNLEDQRAKGRDRMKTLRETDPDHHIKARLAQRKRKAKLRGNTTVKVTARQIRERKAEFNNCCAFCGVDAKHPRNHGCKQLTDEHVVAIHQGGPHSLGNILPACKTCNSSKNDREVETWYRRQPFFTEARWRKICRTLGWHRSSVGQLALL
jgi:hypothetical protein